MNGAPMTIREAMRTAAAVAIVLHLLSCSSTDGRNMPHDSGSLPTGGKTIRQVVVTVGESLSPEKTALAQEHRLRSELEHQIRRYFPSEGGSLSISVNVTDFRLLSAWTAGLGISDFLDVDVTVSENGVFLKSFQSGVKSYRGHSRSARLRHMAEKISEEIAANV